MIVPLLAAAELMLAKVERVFNLVHRRRSGCHAVGFCPGQFSTDLRPRTSALCNVDDGFWQLFNET
jgi:hypothetical protein